MIDFMLKLLLNLNERERQQLANEKEVKQKKITKEIRQQQTINRKLKKQPL